MTLYLRTGLLPEVERYVRKTGKHQVRLHKIDRSPADAEKAEERSDSSLDM